MLMTLTIRAAYGTLRIYPVNDAAEALARIARTTTLSLPNLRDAARLGHRFAIEGPHCDLAREVMALNTFYDANRA
jgi:hypothetical protein